MKLLPVIPALAAAVLMAGAAPAAAQTEIPPPSGKGRAVIVASGASGPAHYETAARAIAQLGYDVILYDGNDLAGTHGEALRTAIAAAPSMPHALPGKVGLVGFSLGGAVALGFGSRWPDQVAVDIVWYPATREIHDITGFASRIAVPVLMFAGTDDTYRNCCLVDNARAIAAAATAAGKPLDLVVYPGVGHDFVIGGSHYDPGAYADALAKTAAKLHAALAQ